MEGPVALALSSVTATAAAAHSSSVDPTFEEETRAHLNCAGSSLSHLSFSPLRGSCLGNSAPGIALWAGEGTRNAEAGWSERGARAPLEHGAVF